METKIEKITKVLETKLNSKFEKGVVMYTQNNWASWQASIDVLGYDSKRIDVREIKGYGRGDNTYVVIVNKKSGADHRKDKQIRIGGRADNINENEVITDSLVDTIVKEIKGE